MINIFIGYDTREIPAYHVCANSIIETSSKPVAFTPLALNNLKSIYTESHIDGSNQFTYSRFLIPELMNFSGWAIFIDGDMVLRDDIVKLWNLRDDRYAAMTVKHDYISSASTKYLGNRNENYPCKNWSSVILWNCGHTKNKILTSQFVEKSIGSYLHRFSWLDNQKDVGELPIEWNWLADEFGENQNAKLVHYTLGTPCFPECANAPMSDIWHKHQSKIRSV
jgi:lipopolysaccharide biosynthesis glycosyltransferase